MIKFEIVIKEKLFSGEDLSISTSNMSVEHQLIMSEDLARRISLAHTKYLIDRDNIKEGER